MHKTLRIISLERDIHHLGLYDLAFVRFDCDLNAILTYQNHLLSPGADLIETKHLEYIGSKVKKWKIKTAWLTKMKWEIISSTLILNICTRLS